MTSLTYVVPPTLHSTLHVLCQADLTARPLAGGTCLIADLRRGETRPDMLLDLRLMTELRQVHLDGQFMSLGALTTFAQLERKDIVRERFPLLAQMAGSLGNSLVRSAVTLGGNIASARTLNTDAVVPLLALDARLVLQTGASVAQRTISLAEYLLEKPDVHELITWIRVPVCSQASHSFYRKLSPRKAGAAAIASIATYVTFQRQRITAARIVLGAFAAQPFRPRAVEALLEGKTVPLNALLVEQCTGRLQKDLPEPLHNSVASSSYRAAMCCALLKKALEQIGTAGK